MFLCREVDHERDSELSNTSFGEKSLCLRMFLCREPDANHDHDLSLRPLG